MLNNMMHTIMSNHNKLVKPEYKVSNINNFKAWVTINGNFEEKYIEISSNETLSGHAEILEI